MTTKHHWHTPPLDEPLAAKLAAGRKMPRPAAEMLIRRGYHTEDAVSDLLDVRLARMSDPSELPDMGPAVERIARALAGREDTVIFGDYDVDGISATAILVQFFESLGHPVRAFIPHRLEHGYGMSAEALAECLGQGQPRLIITVDNGTSATAAVRTAQAAGIDVIVTDHHEPGTELAPALAVVNPKRGGPPGARDLAGAGVAFKLVHALVKWGRANNHPAGQLDPREWLDLAALGTLADIVPLRGENRILARAGLDILNRRERPGIRALCERAGLRGKIGAYQVGFGLAPRLNASGRLGSALEALELLTTVDAARAAEISGELDAANRERQTIEAEIVQQAIAEIDAYFDPDKHFALVVARQGWHPGVIGIVAARVVEKYRRPTVVIALAEDGTGRGSCRSIDVFDIHAALEANRRWLESCGGHRQAAGLDIRATQVDSFRTALNEHAREKLAGRDLRATLTVDAWVNLEEANAELLAFLGSLEPFGSEHPEPLWAVRGILPTGAPRLVGGKHTKLAFHAGQARREAILFNVKPEDLPAGPLDLAFHLRADDYSHRPDGQMVARSFRPHGAE